MIKQGVAAISTGTLVKNAVHPSRGVREDVAIIVSTTMKNVEKNVKKLMENVRKDIK